MTVFQSRQSNYKTPECTALYKVNKFMQIDQVNTLNSDQLNGKMLYVWCYVFYSVLLFLHVTQILPNF